MKIKRILGSLAVAAALLISTSHAAKVGEKAPDFQLTDIEGNVHSLSDYADKVVVLEWVNYGCPYVKKFYSSGSMQAFQKTAAEQGVVWLSICSSKPGSQGHYSGDEWKVESEKRKAHAPILTDEDGTVGKLYRAMTTPHMFVIDPSGTLAYNGAIDSIRSTNIDDISKATNYVEAAYQAILDGREVEKPLTKPYGCDVKY